MNNYKLILTTTDSNDVVKKISDNVLHAKLSPCVQILKGVESKYIWKGKIRNDFETLILIKSLESHSNEICKLIEEHHNYDTPEVVKIDFEILNKKYQKWFIGEVENGN